MGYYLRTQDAFIPAQALKHNQVVTQMNTNAGGVLSAAEKANLVAVLVGPFIAVLSKIELETELNHSRIGRRCD